MKVIDANTKKLHWWNRNYLFLGTLIVLAFILKIAKLQDRKELKEES